MDLKDFAAYVVKKFNVHGIEPYNLHFSSTKPEYLASIREALRSWRARREYRGRSGEEFLRRGPRDAAGGGGIREEMDGHGGEHRFAQHAHQHRTRREHAPNLANAVESMKEVAHTGQPRMSLCTWRTTIWSARMRSSSSR